MKANEAITWLKKKNKKGAMFKLDFNKAYDSIKWAFLDHMLQQLGIGDNMREWIM